MPNDTLYDLKAGDEIALQSAYGYRCGYTQELVAKVTPKRIILKGYESLQFNKEDGYSVGRESRRLITKITPAIKEEWSKKEYLQQIKELIRNQDTPVEALKEAINTITIGTTIVSREECKNILALLLEIRFLSSNTLKEAIGKINNS